MKRHCGWCGKYVAKNAEPIPGFNAYGRRVEQTLCDECGPHWRELAASNESRLNESDFALGLRERLAAEIETHVWHLSSEEIQPWRSGKNDGLAEAASLVRGATADTDPAGEEGA